MAVCKSKPSKPKKTHVVRIGEVQVRVRDLAPALNRQEVKPQRASRPAPPAKGDRRDERRKAFTVTRPTPSHVKTQTFKHESWTTASYGNVTACGKDERAARAELARRLAWTMSPPEAAAIADVR